MVAAGNDGIVGGSALTRHPWVLPVAACTTAGTPSAYSSFGLGIGRRGLSAPGDRITSLAPPDGVTTWSGTSAATPFVTGAAALLWSAVPGASVDALRHALLTTGQGPRTTVVPPRSTPGRPTPFCAERSHEEDTDDSRANTPTPRPPRRVRLPGFAADEAIGLGDAITRVTQAIGIRPCDGCKRRAAALNHWMVIGGRHE